MSEPEQNQKINPKLIFAVIGIIAVLAGGLTLIDMATVEQVEVPAPCFVVMSNDYEMPKNVITKGFTLYKNNETNPDDDVRECYYIKNSGLIERSWRGWNLYD